MPIKLNVLDYAPWSLSKATLASSCSQAFKYRYVDKATSERSGSAAKVGVAVHLALELLLKEQVTSIDKALASAVSDDDNELTTKEAEQVRAYYSNIQSFLDKVSAFTDKHPTKKILVEEEWGIDKYFKPCGFKDPNALFRGIVDWGLLLDSGQLIIIDHKSGRHRAVSYYGAQLDAYSVMGLSKYPTVTSIQSAIHFVKSNTVEWAAPRTAKYVTEVLRPWLEAFLNAKGNAVSEFYTNPGKACRWCDYKSICPDYSRS